MAGFSLLGLCVCVCLLIGSGMTSSDVCSQKQFFLAAYNLEEVEIPHNIENHKVCERLKVADGLIEELWGICGYDCSEELKSKEYQEMNCTMLDKEYNDDMNRTTDPCAITMQVRKCLDYHCPSGKSYPDPVPQGYLDLDRVTYTDDETKELVESRQCTHRPVSKYIRPYAVVNVKNILDCEHCTEIKLNWQYLMADLDDPDCLPTCKASTIQQLSIDIMKVGTKHYIKQCESVKCGASPLSSPLVAMCLVVIGYVFSR